MLSPSVSFTRFEAVYRGYDCHGLLPPVDSLPVKSEKYKVRSFPPVEIVSKTLPTVLYGAALWKPKLDRYSVEGCLRKRLFHKIHGYSHRMLKRLRWFVRRWCKQNLQKLTHLKTFEEWLEETNYSKKRKDELREIYYSSVLADVFSAPVKIHVKDEFYGEPKFPRMISSRDDVAKCYLGPIFSSIEDVLYPLPFFVKGLTDAERVHKLNDLFGTRDVYVTDYSAFETHFTPDLMYACEYQVYKYLLSDFPDALKLVQVIMHKNRLQGKMATGSLEGVRMSGEMNTSLGNGISNYLLMHFMAEEEGFKILNCVVEGDDGLFEIRGTAPTPELAKNKYGLELKIQPAKPYSASFCGCIYNPVTLTNFGHVLDHLASFGWLGRRHISLSERKQRELIMSRVYSFNASFPGVPLIWKVCQLCIKHYGRVPYVRCLKYLDRWRTTQSHLRLTEEVVEPLIDDRSYFSELSGISIDEQYVIEKDFEKSFPLLYSETLLDHVPRSFIDAWNSNVFETGR